MTFLLGLPQDMAKLDQYAGSFDYIDHRCLPNSLEPLPQPYSEALQ